MKTKKLNIEEKGPAQRTFSVPAVAWKTYHSGMFRLIAISVTITLLLSGCASLDQLIQKPTASFAGMHLSQADLMKGTAVFDFNVSNPNPIPIRVGRITYDLKLNDRNFVSGDLDQGMRLAANGTSRLSVPITMQYLDFFDSLSQMWKARGADYALTGGFAVGPFTVPFKARGKFDLPKMPKLSLENVKIDKLTLSDARLSFRLKMDNPNTFQLLLKRLDYHLKLGNTSFAKASALPNGPIAANSAATMNVGFDISFAQLGQSAYHMLLGADTNYRLEGALVFDEAGGKENRIPMKAAGRVPFLR